MCRLVYCRRKMDAALTIIPVAVGAYIATNLDNFALLVTLLARYHERPWAVSAGYLTGVVILGFTGYWIGVAAAFAPVKYLGFLGLVPISIGAVAIYRLLRAAPGESPAIKQQTDRGHAAFATTVLSQIGNGADTIVTFGALFADSAPGSDLWIIATLAVMAVSFVGIASACLRHPEIKSWIDRYAHLVTPFILIIVGAYIFANTASDVLPG